MKREILFRGKRIDNGEWVYGTPIYPKGYDKVIITTGELAVPNVPDFGFVQYEVIPETVCQYTGLKDRNGKEIWEGDIVVCRYANEYTPVFQNGIYMAYNPKEMKTIQQPSTQFNIIWRNGCEVIGTIFDKEESNDYPDDFEKVKEIKK